ncbi:PIG-L family deacetylase [Isoptericola sp. b441]|uniref:PIG-L family deacetylase n=1 Tax=Actinotalea lenta TaxID=3064654 RepID=A0ABT9D7P6_9CELL|nr:PIG-L family deacetylase [Isoptericola sp. b441]MDO8106876.1 PIG-L family deacetylase [Isoptericola sp. b441]
MTDGAGPPDGGLLAVHAHPDDETLSTGALLATWARAGRAVTVVTCTRGERGEVIGRRLARLSGDPDALAAHRAGELAGALEALGVSDHVTLDEVAGDGPWVDSGMVWADVGRAAIPQDAPQAAFARVDLDLAADRLARLVCDRRPSVVVTYEPDGGYGHPDHVHAHAVTMRAVQLAAERGWQVPCVLWAALDADQLVSGREWCARTATPGLVAAVGRPLPSAAVAPAEVAVRVAVAPVLERVLGAMRAHATQVQAVEALEGEGCLGCYALSDAVVQPVPAQECYRVGSQNGPVGWPDGVRVR